MHEPALVQGDAPSLRAMYEKAYAELAKVQVPMHIVTYFDDLDEDVMKWVVVPGVNALSLDFTRGDNISTLEKVPFPASVRLGAASRRALGLVGHLSRAVPCSTKSKPRRRRPPCKSPVQPSAR